MESLFMESLFIESLLDEALLLAFLCFIVFVPLCFMLSLDMLSFEEDCPVFCIEFWSAAPCWVCGVLWVVGVDIEPAAVDCWAAAVPATSRQLMASVAASVFVVRMFLPSWITPEKIAGKAWASPRCRIVCSASNSFAAPQLRASADESAVIIFAALPQKRGTSKP